MGHTSFPSGHVSLTSACLITWAFLYRKEPSQRWPFYLVYGWIIWIAWTRLYCGAHWLTDVLGGFLLGSLLANIAYSVLNRYQPELHTHLTKRLCLFTFGLWLASATWIASTHYHRYYPNFFPTPPMVTLDEKNWSTDTRLPIWRLNRFHHPFEVLNIRLQSSSLKPLQQILCQKGWHIHHAFKSNWLSCSYDIISHPERMKLRQLLPPLFQGNSPALIASKEQGHTTYRLELWPSYFQVKNTPIWLGSVIKIGDNKLPTPMVQALPWTTHKKRIGSHTILTLTL